MKLFGKGAKGEAPRRRAATARLEEESVKFRRSATLTGSLSDDIHATAEDRGHLQSARVEAQSRRKARRLRVRRFGLLLIGFGVLTGLYLGHINSFTVSFAGAPKRLPSTTPYIASAKEFASGSMGNQFAPTLDTAKLSAYLASRHKEIAAVTVDRQLFDTSPALTVTLRKPVLMWQTKNDTTAFYVDAVGIAFSFNAFSNDSQLVRVNDESGVPAELGVPVASSRQISFLGQLVGQVAQSSGGKLTISRITFPSSSTKEINVYFKDRKYFAKVYLERAARAQADELVRGVTFLETQKNVVPAEYVDVRIAGRLFYK